MIQLTNLGFEYTGSPVLRGISLEVAAGEVVAIMGANGTGKTTLLKVLAGLRDPDSGTVDCEGTVGFAPEDPTAGLFAETVEDEVAFYPANRGLDVPDRTESAMEAMDITALRNRGPYSLSVGEQRRVSIASVVAGAPDVLALDEPTVGLDRTGERHVAGLISDLEATIVFSTHAAEFAYLAADRVAVLANGAIARTGPAREVLAEAQVLREAGIQPPGIVSWAHANGIDPPPRDIDEAVASQRVDQ